MLTLNVGRESTLEKWGLQGDWENGTGLYRITEVKEEGKAEGAGLKVDGVVVAGQGEEAVTMQLDRFEEIMKEDLQIKIKVIRVGMKKITSERAWEEHMEEKDRRAKEDQAGDEGIEDGPGKRGDRWEMDWEDILQEEENRRGREEEDGDEEEEFLVFGGLDEEEAEVVEQAAKGNGAEGDKEDDDESVAQEEEACWERNSVAQGAWHWERNMMKRIAKEKLERAAALRQAKRKDAFTKGPLPKGVIEVHKAEEEGSGSQHEQARPRTEEEEEFLE